MTYRWTPETEAELRRLWDKNICVLDIRRHFRVGQETIDAARKRLGLPTRASGFWTPEREAEARRLYVVEGRSASEIARAIGAASRNVVIGKAHRRGWTHARPSKPGPEKCYPRKPTAPKVARTHVRPPKPGPQNRAAVNLGGYQHERDFARAEIVRAKKSADGLARVAGVVAGGGVESPNAVPLLDYVRGCKWPLGERGAVRFCCNPQVEGRTYCEGHLAMSLAPVQPDHLKSRDAARLTRFDRVDREVRAPAHPPRTPWDDARLEAA